MCRYLLKLTRACGATPLASVMTGRLGGIEASQRPNVPKPKGLPGIAARKPLRILKWKAYLS